MASPNPLMLLRNVCPLELKFKKVVSVLVILSLIRGLGFRIRFLFLIQAVGLAPL